MASSFNTHAFPASNMVHRCTGYPASIVHPMRSKGATFPLSQFQYIIVRIFKFRVSTIYTFGHQTSRSESMFDGIRNVLGPEETAEGFASRRPDPEEKPRAQAQAAQRCVRKCRNPHFHCCAFYIFFYPHPVNTGTFVYQVR